MATSFARTREQMRDKVFGSMGLYDPDDGVTNSDAVLFYEALDLLLKQLHELGILWWKVSPTTTDVTLTASDATEDAPTDLMYMISMTIRDGNTDTDVELITHREYMALENKSETGKPYKAYVDQEAQKIFLYPAPNSAYTLRETYMALPDDTVAATAPDVPQWALRSLVDILKDDLADHWDIFPPESIVRWERKANKAWKTLRTLNAPHQNHSTVKVTNY